MIFLPNKYERFCAAIRNRIQNHSFSSPLSIKDIGILRKIYIAEAIFKETEIVPIDIKLYAENILGAVQILKLEKEQRFTYKILTTEKYLLDKKIIEIVLVLLAYRSNYINIFEHKSRLIIESEPIPDKRINILLKKMLGYSFIERKSKRTFLVFPVNKTEKQSVSFIYEKEILDNPFSSANIFS